jgi:hypothetical protein
MTDLTTKIGKYDPESRAVPVTFTSGEIVHKRNVNAVIKDDGSYDKAATAERVAEVAQGVAHKIAAGVITAPKPASEPEANPAE